MLHLGVEPKLPIIRIVVQWTAAALTESDPTGGLCRQMAASVNTETTVAGPVQHVVRRLSLATALATRPVPFECGTGGLEQKLSSVSA